MSWPVIVLLGNVVILSVALLVFALKAAEWKSQVDYYKDEAENMNRLYRIVAEHYRLEAKEHDATQRKLSQYERASQQKQLNSNERGIEL
jgi:hypothetical protein